MDAVHGTLRRPRTGGKWWSTARGPVPGGAHARCHAVDRHRERLRGGVSIAPVGRRGAKKYEFDSIHARLLIMAGAAIS
jgi:hypothetical protein